MRPNTSMPAPLQLLVGHCAVTLGEAMAGRAERQRHMNVRRRVRAEQRGEMGLPGRRGQQVVAADDLVDTLLGVIDDHGEVVGRHAIATPQHEVVDRADVRTVDLVVDA